MTLLWLVAYLLNVPWVGLDHDVLDLALAGLCKQGARFFIPMLSSNLASVIQKLNGSKIRQIKGPN